MSQDVGAMPPPVGVTPNFDGLSTLQKTVVIVFSCTFFIASFIFALRLYCAAALVRKVDWDIPLIILAWAGSLSFFIVVILAIPFGFGKHLWDVRVKSLSGYMDLILALCLTYVWPPTFAKLAILVLYHRLIPNKHFRVTIYVVAGILIITTVVFTGLMAGPCAPKFGIKDTCDVQLIIAQGALNIASDVVLILLPTPMIYRLHMPLRQRITAILLLALGSAVVVISCIRFGYVQIMDQDPDDTWIQAQTSLWSCIEMNVAIICNCLAHLAPFVRRHLPRFKKFVSRGMSRNKDTPEEMRHCHAYRQWGGERTSHGYELHSVGRSHQVSPVELEGGIVVVEEYSVDFTLLKKGGDGSSTEEILRN